VQGRKRHIAVDTLGLPLLLWVHEASLPDRTAALSLIPRLLASFPTVQKFWVDAAYRGPDLRALAAQRDLDIEVVCRRDDRSHGTWTEPGEVPASPGGGFEILPRRWVVERTFAWLGRSRRLSKDYEALPAVSEAFCGLATLRLFLGRLTRGPPQHPSS
jgi:putative transposase